MGIKKMGGSSFCEIFIVGVIAMYILRFIWFGSYHDLNIKEDILMRQSYQRPHYDKFLLYVFNDVCFVYDSVLSLIK